MLASDGRDALHPQGARPMARHDGLRDLAQPRLVARLRRPPHPQAARRRRRHLVAGVRAAVLVRRARRVLLRDRLRADDPRAAAARGLRPSRLVRHQSRLPARLQAAALPEARRLVDLLLAGRHAALHSPAGSHGEGVPSILGQLTRHSSGYLGVFRHDARRECILTNTRPFPAAENGKKICYADTKYVNAEYGAPPLSPLTDPN